MGYNYFYDLKNGGTQKWANYINQKYIDLSGIPVLYFKMDKVATPIDTLYGEEEHSRYYLNPIEINSIALDPVWKQVLGFADTQLYQEKSEPISFVVNLDNMVQTIRGAKNSKLVNFDISYTGIGAVSCLNINGNFQIKVNGTPIVNVNLSSYPMTNSLYTYLSGITNLSINRSGGNYQSSQLVQFNETSFTGNIISVYVRNTEYDNCTDAIEKGDIVLTPNNYLFEVATNMITGDFGWDYSTYTMQCSRMSLENVTLPNNYIQRVYRKDGRLERINFEGYSKAQIR